MKADELEKMFPGVFTFTTVCDFCEVEPPEVKFDGFTICKKCHNYVTQHLKAYEATKKRMKELLGGK